MNKITFLLASYLLNLCALHAEVRLASVFSDHMVLQRDQEMIVWGTADQGEEVVVELAGQRAHTITNEAGQWEVHLNPLSTSSKPVPFHVRGAHNSIELKHVLVGEVWLCTGQSNMNWKLEKSHNGAQVSAKAKHPQIRLLTISWNPSFKKVTQFNHSWTECTPETAAQFSAVGYYFGRELQATLGVPIGLINCSVGGSPAQAWISRKTLEQMPRLSNYAKIARYDEEVIKNLWHEFETVSKPEWEQKMAKYEEAKKTNPKARKPKLTKPDRNHKLPSVLYNGMLHPLIAFPVSGAIWYQGEANAKSKEMAEEYPYLLSSLIAEWRDDFQQKDMPFLIAQLPGYKWGRAWPYLRESQRMIDEMIPNTGLVVTLDVGENKDIHPRNKETVGHRFALMARAMRYGENIVHRGPEYLSHQVDGAQIRIQFKHIGSGLTIGQPPLRVNDAPNPPKDRLAGFEVAGEDGLFHEAEAQLVDDSVIVQSEAVPAPKHVRYAWAAFPEVNLYNREGLPAGPFHSQKPAP